MQADVKKLVIKKKDGSFIEERLMNVKGYRKSIERGILWVVHSETERLLPYGENAKFLEIKDLKDSYEAIVPNDFMLIRELKCSQLVDNVDNSCNSEEKVNNLDTNQKVGQVLTDLENVIKDRHQKMPEGSYTTHLFKSGAEKIRKKTGEEAVELILAGKKEDIIYEAADLVYHMMVLLESEGISMAELMTELEKR